MECSQRWQHCCRFPLPLKILCITIHMTLKARSLYKSIVLCVCVCVVNIRVYLTFALKVKHTLNSWLFYNSAPTFNWISSETSLEIQEMW